MTEKAIELLRKFYPPGGMFLQELSGFSESTASIMGTFNVPTSAAYSVVPLNCVTAEQYVRCFSQLSYGLIYLLSIYSDGMNVCGTVNDFERLMFSGQMWYRRMSLHFVRRVTKGNDFKLRAEVGKVRHVSRFG